MITRGKKIISSILALSMVLSFSTVFAGAVNTEEREKAQEIVSAVTDNALKEDLSVSEIQKDVKALEERMIDTDSISVYDINEDGHVVYAYILDEDIATVYVDTWEGTEGDTYLRLKEEEHINVFCFKPDGSIYLNGAKVEVQTTSGMVADQAAFGNGSGGIEPMAGMYSSFYLNPLPNTTFSSYTGAQTLYDSTALTNLANTLSAIGVAGAVVLVTNAWGGLVAKIGQSIFNSVITSAMQQLVSKAPNARGITFTDYRKAHPNNNSTSMRFRHDVKSVPNTGMAVTKYYYEDRYPT